MNHLFQLLVFFGISMLGDFIAKITKIFIPGSIIGMIILFLLLCFGVIKLESIRETGAFLLDNMLLFILPSAVGVITTYYLVADKLISYLLLNVLTTIVIFLATAFTAQGVIHHTNKKEKREKITVGEESKDGRA